MFSRLSIGRVTCILFLLVTVSNIVLFINNHKGLYTERFDAAWYQKLYGQSQYVRTDPISILPDEIVYSYAGWRYLEGENPAIFNADQPPLGKYFIGISERYLQNGRVVGIVFNILVLITLFFLVRIALKSNLWALGLTTLFSFEKLFWAQAQYAPLLDNIQLFFILLSFIFYILSLKKEIFLIPAFICLGGVISTKFWVTGVVILAAWIMHALLEKNFRRTIYLIILIPVAIGVLLLAYTPSLLQGYSPKKVLSVQKYIYEFHHEKLSFRPLAVWNLLLLNRWYAPSEKIVRPAVDWQVTWPFITIMSTWMFLKFIVRQKKYKFNSEISLIIVWFIVYLALLLIGEVLPRYIFPVLPFMYILTAYMLKEFLIRFKTR